MKAKAALGLAALVLAALAIAGTARAYTLADYVDAVNALLAVDPTIAAPANDPKKDFVTGGFRSTDGYSNGVSAQSDPANANPKGHFSAQNPGGSGDVEAGLHIRGDVICMAVDGNTAATGIRGTISDGNEVVPYTEVEIYRDGGPGGALDGFTAFSNSNPEACAAALLIAGGADPIINGNILINDAT